jgi:hypothetical protein
MTFLLIDQNRLERWTLVGFSWIGLAQVLYFETKYGTGGCYWCLAYRWLYFFLWMGVHFSLLYPKFWLFFLVRGIAFCEIGVSFLHLFYKINSIPCVKNLSPGQNSWACGENNFHHFFSIFLKPVGLNALLGLIVLGICLVSHRRLGR